MSIIPATEATPATNPATEAALDRVRGDVPARTHTARTIAALTTNPGCGRRAIVDAAGVDKSRLAAHVGFPAQFGQSQFAITRGKAFEAQVKADGCAQLLSLMRDTLGLELPEATYDDLTEEGTDTSPSARYARTRKMLEHAAGGSAGAGSLIDHPMLRLEVGGRHAYLEPDLIALQWHGRFHIVEVKSFPIIDGQADGEKVAAAAIQSAVYVYAMRALLADLGCPADAVDSQVVLVCPKDFANQPTATVVDVRRQLTVLRRQLARLDRVDELLAALPDSLSLATDRPSDKVAADLRHVDGRYLPECLTTCELARFCRSEARGRTRVMGRTVSEDLGGVESVELALALARGTATPTPEQEEAAALLRLAWSMRAELAGPAPVDVGDVTPADAVPIGVGG